jgi:UDP-glucuronate 4-epimerase
MAYLITGGAGFIGSNLADKLLESGEKVIVIDNFDPYYDRKIKESNIKSNLTNKNYTFIEGDIRDAKLLKKIITNNNIEKIFHLAARAGVRFSVEDPYSYSELNVNGTLNLLKVALATKIRRIVLASSSSVYGIEKKLPVNEESPTLPISPYGASKLACEAFCNSFMSVFGMPIVILRYFTVYGPRQRPDMAIHKFFKMISKGETITIFGNGRQTRDFTFVADTVAGTMKAMESDATGVFNLGSGRRIELEYLIDLIGSSVGKKVNKKYTVSQKGDVPDTYADITKARKTFGYAPSIKIEEGIRKFKEWFD